MLRSLGLLALVVSLPVGRGCDARGPRGRARLDGMFVAYNAGCERGCDAIRKGDLILTVDGVPVPTSAAYDAIPLTDGRPHTLEVRSRERISRVEIVARPGSDLPPLVDTPPLWTVGSRDLDAAPPWARRRMFGHVSPIVGLRVVGGGILEGRSMVGTKHLLVYWDRRDAVEERNAGVFMQVLQKAQADLDAAGVAIVFAHVPFPKASKPPMTDAELIAWAEARSIGGPDGPLPSVPLARRPTRAEHDGVRELGVEPSYAVMENLADSPAIVLLDERGVVRWHSEGLAVGDRGLPPEQHTIIEAVLFCLSHL